MSEIKQVSTGKAELLLVKVPEGWKLSGTTPNFLYFYPSKSIKLPEGNWQIVGISDQLTEEQCRELFVKGGNESIGELYKFNDLFYAEAIKAGAALLKANDCYTVNPYGEKPELSYTGDNCEDDVVDYIHKLYLHTKAEAHTGSWLFLKRL
jgi:hypothetical protein